MTAYIDAAARPASFTLVVPGFEPAWQRAGASRPTLPTLNRLVRRGAVSRHDVARPGWLPGHLRLLDLLGLHADSRHGGAALEWLGLGGEPRLGAWARAGFVHLEVGSHEARLHAIMDLDARDAAQLVSVLEAGLQFPGVTVLPSPDPQQCPGIFLHAGVLDAVCPLPAFDALVELRDVLPQGKDGPVLRRLMTEAQMLLHDHPVNADRERRKLRTANAIWLAGVSEFAGMSATSLPRIASNGTYLKGLCRLHGAAAGPVPESAVNMMFAGAPALVERQLPGESDPAASLSRLEHDWFAPLAGAIRSGRIEAAVIELDTLQVRIDRASLRRFWRRGPGLSELLQ